MNENVVFVPSVTVGMGRDRKKQTWRSEKMDHVGKIVIEDVSSSTEITGQFLISLKIQASDYLHSQKRFQYSSVRGKTCVRVLYPDNE